MSDINKNQSLITNEQLSEQLAVVARNVARLVEDVSGLKEDVSGLKEDVSGLKEKTGGLEIKIMELRSEMHDEFKQVKERLSSLEDRAFGSKEEKDNLVALSPHYDKRLYNETLGKGDITLTRPEYDSVQKVADFPHRFVKTK